MARTRQQAKQRKAKRLEQERKAAERAARAQGAAAPDDARAGGRRGRDAGVEVEDARPDTEAEVKIKDTRPDAETAVEVELEDAQRQAVTDLQEAQRAAEAASAPEIARVPVEEPPEKVRWRDRRKREVAKEEETAAKPPSRAERKREREAKPAPRAERKVRHRGRVVNFLVQVWAELRRVQWPDRNQVTQATAIVVVFCLLAGTYLGVLDFLFNKLIKVIL